MPDPLLKAPTINLEQLNMPGQAGESVDLSAQDWVPTYAGGTRCPRWFHANFTGTLQAIPLLADPLDTTGVTIAVVAGTKVDWSFRKIIRAGSSAPLQVVNALVAAY